ncbi:MAG TPA: protein kinase [Bryobacteraceae bacterium]|jgi:serine/threonine protein kinase
MRFRRRTQKVELDQDAENNVFLIEGEEHFLEHIDAADIRRGGANSSVFRAVHPDGDDSYVVKFCRYPLDTRYPRDQRRIQRFEREIQALHQARTSPQAKCVIPILEDSQISLVAESGGPAPIRYYVMEEADSDLATYLEENDLELPQRILLCDELLKILKGLHTLGIYHRDIKPENILMRQGLPVFGDLGLIAFRAEDHDLDEFDEKVGPIGYLSPEATNKALGLRSKGSFAFDCVIDDKSDIFQLGQVFWLVVQDEVPTGHLIPNDLRCGVNALLENVIRPMLQYGKQRRASLGDVETALQPVLKEMAII